MASDCPVIRSVETRAVVSSATRAACSDASPVAERDVEEVPRGVKHGRPGRVRRWAGGDAADALLIGDSTWDCEAAGRAGVRAIAVLTGGFSDEELRDAGAERVYRRLRDLMEDLDELC